MSTPYDTLQDQLRQQPRHWLVTGAAGFIGLHVAQRLLARGDEVVGLDNLNAYYDPQLKRDRLALLEGQRGFRFVQLDVADRQGMADLFAAERFDRVVLPAGLAEAAAAAAEEAKALPAPMQTWMKAIIVAVVNFLVDVIAALIDPRVRY